jgi:hypothetical protein
MDQPSAVPEDVSPKTILVLVILTLAISFIGAWVNINSAVQTAEPSHTAAPQGEVSFYIVGKEPAHTDKATGLVSLEITS